MKDVKREEGGLEGEGRGRKGREMKKGRQMRRRRKRKIRKINEQKGG